MIINSVQDLVVKLLHFNERKIINSHFLIVGEGAKSSASPLNNTNWTVPQANQTNDKRKPLDDRYAGVSRVFFIINQSV